MELVLAAVYRPGRGKVSAAASATVERGRVTEASPSFAWAVGEGVHVLLSYCQKNGIRWWRKKRTQQMELFL